MSAALCKVPQPANEPVLAHAPGSPERAALEAELARQAATPVEIPCLIDGREVYTGNVWELRNPSAHGEVLARVHLAGPAEVEAAIAGALRAKADWAALPWEERVAVFLRAATLLSGPWRAEVLAATMLGQGKTVHQAEIDAAAELVDFWRFNAWWVPQILAEQPPVSPAGTWNRLDHRPLDGFVLAITPFNFTSIALNLPTAPAMLGNVVVWKPSLQTSLAVWVLMRLLRAAGLPDGVIQLVHGHGADVGEPAIASPHLGGLHFTGSVRTFQTLWKSVADHLPRYRQYPRIVGETGGKDFVLLHRSADLEAAAVALLRGAYEYQGQKCSAASRLYVPRDLWPELRDRLVAGIAAFRQGDVRDFRNFLGPVIDERAFDRISRYIDLGRREGTVHAGGTYDRTHGWYVAPTLVEVADPGHRLMRDEIFGPVLTTWVYEPDDWEGVLRRVDETSDYALTGAVFANDRAAIARATEALRFAAGNFYVNDKPTGAVVGQQPFGGSRASGTNDKAGSPLNLLRWVSPRAIKENFDPPRDWRYPFLG